MEVLTREKCKECYGTGLVYSGIWKEFNELDDQYKKEHGHFMSNEDCEAWFRERGYHKFPSEEHSCGECEGSGLIAVWKSIDEIASMVFNIGIHTGHIKP